MTGSSITYHRHFADHVWTYKELFLSYVCHKAVISLLYPLYFHFVYTEYIKLRKKFVSMNCIRLPSQLKQPSERKEGRKEGFFHVNTKTLLWMVNGPLWLTILPSLFSLCRLSDEETYLRSFLYLRLSSCYLSFIYFFRLVISVNFALFIFIYTCDTALNVTLLAVWPTAWYFTSGISIVVSESLDITSGSLVSLPRRAQDAPPFVKILILPASGPVSLYPCGSKIPEIIQEVRSVIGDGTRQAKGADGSYEMGIKQTKCNLRHSRYHTCLL